MPGGTESGRGGGWRSAGPGIPRGAGVLKTCLGTTRTKARKERLTTPAPNPGPHGYSDRAVKTVAETNLLFSGLEDWKFWPHTHFVSQPSGITVSLAGVPPGPRQCPFPIWPTAPPRPGPRSSRRWQVGFTGKNRVIVQSHEDPGAWMPGAGVALGSGGPPRTIFRYTETPQARGDPSPKYPHTHCCSQWPTLKPPRWWQLRRS